MSEPIQLGLYVSGAQAGPSGPRVLSFDELLDIVLQAEAAGFHSVWWPDHYFIQVAPGQRRGSFECWTLLCALAARTSRIKIGSLVLCNTFRHPALVAKQAASLQQISGGRVILGLGSGWHEPEYQALGLPFSHRVSKIRESAAIIRELFDKGTSSFQGRWWKLDDAELLPRPATRVPLWIAARGPQMLEITARYADGWNAAWFADNAEPWARIAGELVEHRRHSDAAARPLELTAGVQVYVTAPGGQDSATATLKQSNPAFARLDDDEIKQQILLGDAETVAAGLTQYQRSGASLAILAFPGLTQFPAGADSLSRLFRDLPAALKSAVAS